MTTLLIYLIFCLIVQSADTTTGAAVNGSTSSLVGQSPVSVPQTIGPQTTASPQLQIPSAPSSMQQQTGLPRQIQAVTTVLVGSTQPQPVFVIQNGQLVQLFQPVPTSAQSVPANAGLPQSQQQQTTNVPTPIPTPAASSSPPSKPDSTEQTNALGSSAQAQVDPLMAIQLSPMGDIAGIEIFTLPSTSNSILPNVSVRIPKDYIGVLQVMKEGEFARLVAIPPMTMQQQAAFISMNRLPVAAAATTKTPTSFESNDPRQQVPTTSSGGTSINLDQSSVSKQTSASGGTKPTTIKPVADQNGLANKGSSMSSKSNSSSSSTPKPDPSSSTSTTAQMSLVPTKSNASSITTSTQNGNLLKSNQTVSSPVTVVPVTMQQGNTTLSNPLETRPSMETTPRIPMVQAGGGGGGDTVPTDMNTLPTLMAMQSRATRALDNAVLSTTILTITVFTIQFW